MQILARSIIISTGAQAQWLDAKNEEQVKGSGVSTCATCDGAFYEDKEVSCGIRLLSTFRHLQID